MLKYNNTIDYENIISNNNIHRTVIIEEGAKIGKNVKIGPFSCIGKNVIIGNNCEIKSHVIITGNTQIGNNNIIFPFTVIGEIPQDLKFENEISYVKIGNNNKIREHCTIHAGTKADNCVTIIGNNNLLMVNSHIAHDCIIGDNCVIANNVALAGHVCLEDNVIIGGNSAIHQKVRIGKGAIVGGVSAVVNDVPPYFTAVNEERAKLVNLNLIGLKRAKIPVKEINLLRRFFKDVFLSKENESLFNLIEEKSNLYKESKIAQEIIDFINGDSTRHICTVSK